ncbi:MAG: hypothetical protein GY757_31675, partial [bacterium]|nr:hypothetical protein [bacterium]
MKNPAPAITDKLALEKVIICLEKNIPMETQGSCDQKIVFDILTRAAATGGQRGKYLQDNAGCAVRCEHSLSSG